MKHSVKYIIESNTTGILIIWTSEKTGNFYHIYGSNKTHFSLSVRCGGTGLHKRE